METRRKHFSYAENHHHLDFDTLIALVCHRHLAQQVDHSIHTYSQMQTSLFSTNDQVVTIAYVLYNNISPHVLTTLTLYSVYNNDTFVCP